MVRMAIAVVGLVGLVCLAGCNSQDTANLKQDTQQLGRDIAPIPANAALKTKVLAHLSLLKGVKLSNVDVQADNKIVTVSGRVSDEATHQKIIGAVKETSGVDQVVDKLQIGE